MCDFAICIPLSVLCKSMKNIIVRFFFLTVVKFCKCRLLSVFTLKCFQDQPVRKLRILRQQWSMKISSYYIFINHTFIPGPAVISLSVQNFAQRFVIVDAGSSTVIFSLLPAFQKDHSAKQYYLSGDLLPARCTCRPDSGLRSCPVLSCSSSRAADIHRILQ